MPHSLLSRFAFLGCVLALGSAAGCGLLIGNVKPVEEKSEQYGVLDLSYSNPDWVKLPEDELPEEDAGPEKGTQKGHEKDKEGAPSTAVPDVAYQSQKTSSIISLNSVCRPANKTFEPDLREVSRLLTLGFTQVTLREQRDLTVGGRPALETTVRGKLNGVPTMLRTVVVHHDDCVYDMVYVARPPLFESQERDFTRFVSSLRLK